LDSPLSTWKNNHSQLIRPAENSKYGLAAIEEVRVGSNLKYDDFPLAAAGISMSFPLPCILTPDLG
jgi:hypothetical protein